MKRNYRIIPSVHGLLMILLMCSPMLVRVVLPVEIIPSGHGLPMIPVNYSATLTHMECTHNSDLRLYDHWVYSLNKLMSSIWQPALFSCD